MGKRRDRMANKVYIAGKISGDPDYREKFAKAEEELKAQGYITKK